MKTNYRLAFAVVGAAALTTFSQVRAQTLELNYEADNYLYTSQQGTWSDSSGNDDTATAYQYLSPGLEADATPSGADAVNFALRPFTGGSDTTFNKALTVSTPLTSADFTTTPNFTIAVVANLINPGSGVDLMTGGNAGGGGDLGFRANSDGSFGLTDTGNADIGFTPSGVYTFGTWAVFQATYQWDSVTNSGSYVFYLNGQPVGVGTSGNGFPLGLDVIGNLNQGLIADIQVYDGAMDPDQVVASYNSLNAEYLTAAAAPEPSTWLLFGLGVTGVAAAMVARRQGWFASL